MRENTRSDKAIQARNARYLKYVERLSPRSGNLTALTKAFLIGGATCVIGELISNGLMLLFPDVGNEMIATYTSMILVTVAILFTGLGFYDVIARQGGAGSFLPITGFANAMSSAALEFKSEGLILGTSVKMFSVVGPVIVNGIVWSAVAGLLRYVLYMIL